MTNRLSGFLSRHRRRLYTSAATLGLLALAVWLFFFIGNGGCALPVGVSVLDARLIAPDRLALTVPSCNQNPKVSFFRETDIDVQVRVVAALPPFLKGGQDCADSVEVQLQEPLGDRDVIDRRDGVVVEVRRRQAQEAGNGSAEMPDVAPPKIGDAPSEAELEDLRYIARQEGIPLQAAIERYGWRDNFSLAAAQIGEAVPDSFSEAEIVDDRNAWIAFKGQEVPQEARDIINEFRSSHSGVSVQIRTGAGLTEEERMKAIETVHYAVYQALEVRNATTTFDSETGRIRTVVVLDWTAPGSAIKRLKAFAETKLIEATRPDILDDISVVVVRSRLGALGGVDIGR